MSNQYQSFGFQLFNDPNRVPIGEVSRTLFKIIREIQTSSKRKIITNNGKAVAAICPLEDVAFIEIHNKETDNDR